MALWRSRDRWSCYPGVFIRNKCNLLTLRQMNLLYNNKRNRLPVMVLVMTLCGIILFSSCSEDFLTPTPLSFYEPGVTLSSESGMQAVMAMTDRHLRHYWTHQENNAGHNSNPMGTEYMFSDLMAYGK